jgi:hypothetical protein
LIPNHPTLDFIHYRSAVRLRGSDDPAAVLEVLFEKNGWGGAWRNGIYDYVHYHPRTHEVLGLASGTARVQFGGPAARSSHSRPETSSFCRRAPVTRPCGPARTLWWSARTRPTASTMNTRARCRSMAGPGG